MADGKNYKRISLELSATWPGVTLLRFEPHGGGSVMIELASEDLATLGALLARHHYNVDHLKDQVRALQALGNDQPAERHDPKTRCKFGGDEPGEPS